MLLPPDGYLQAVQAICRAHGVLFVVDEVICGYGRVGDWFASSRVGLEPDAITFAKGITSGYVPLGGVIVGRRSRSRSGSRATPASGATATRTPATRAPPRLRTRTSTSSSARAFSRAASRSRRRSPDALAPLAGHELVSEIRAGFGAVAAVQVDPARLADDPGLTDRVTFGHASTASSRGRSSAAGSRSRRRS